MRQAQPHRRRCGCLATRALTLVTVLSLAACGSTVQRSTREQLAGTAGLGTVAAAPASSAAALGGQGESGIDAAGTNATGGSAAAGSNTVGQATSPSLTEGSAVAPGSTYRDSAGIAQGVGVTATSIYIGIP